MNVINPFKTSDTPLAAYLYSEGFKIIDIDYSNPTRAEFLFANNNPQILEHVRLFNLGVADVNAATYARLLRKLTKCVTRQLPWDDNEGISNV